MRIPREIALLVVLLLMLAAAALWIRPEAREETQQSLSSHSPAPGGALALYLWLESLGYRTGRLEYQAFQPNETQGALIIMAPRERPSTEELTNLRRWVERGGTLVVVGSESSNPTLGLNDLLLGRGALGSILGKFGLSLRPLGKLELEAVPAQPLLQRPAVSRVRVEAENYVAGPAGLVPYLGDPERPIAAGLAVERGMVYVVASGHALSNQGLGEADNGALLLNWLPAAGATTVVAFDEVHHGLGESRSLLALMLREPWGWAVFYVLGMVFIYLALRGRRLGRAVADAAEGRRAAAEYVVSLADLLRRGDKRGWVAAHYERALRRQLAASFGLDPTLDAEAVSTRLAELGKTAAGMDGRRIGGLLGDLAGGGKTNEHRLVQLANEASKAIKICAGRRE